MTGAALLVAAMIQAAPVSPIVVDNTRDTYEILGSIEMLADATSSLTVNDLADATFVAPSDVPELTDGWYWLRFAARTRHGTRRGSWCLSMGPPFDPGSFFVPAADGWHETVIDNDMVSSPLCLSLSLTRDAKIYYLRVPFVRSPPPLFLIASADAHVRVHRRHLARQSIYLIVVLAVALANLGAAILIRGSEYLWYAAYVLSSASYFALSAGLVNIITGAAWSRSVLVLPQESLLAMMAFTGAQFSRRFLRTRTNARVADAALQIFAALALATAVLPWTVSGLALKVAWVGMALPFVTIPAGWVCVRAGARWARFYVVAWSIFSLSGFVFAAPVPLPVWVRSAALQTGSTVELFLILLALYERLDSFRREADLSRARLARSERLASLGQLVAGVAHEVNNPNNFVAFNVPILHRYLRVLEDTTREHAPRDTTILGMTTEEFFVDAHKIINNMDHGAQRIQALVEQLRNYTRVDTMADPEPVDLNEIAVRAARMVLPEVQPNGTTLEVSTQPLLPRVMGSSLPLEQVVVNLLLNAGAATRHTPSGCIWLTTELVRLASRAWVRLRVSDNGPGVPPHDVERIFDPFFTTKGSDGGSGMGLAISRRIVERHGGGIRFEPASAGGASFVVDLPALKDRA